MSEVAEVAKRTEPDTVDTTVVEPDAKRAKVEAPSNAAVIRKQVEYYLSDDNLKFDKFFHDKISGDKDGWLEISLILSCNKMKTLRATTEAVVSSLADSKLEMREDKLALRRPINTALPGLEARPQQGKKASPSAHLGGVMVAFTNLPAEQGWQQIKEELKKVLPPKVALWFVSEVTAKGMCYVAVAPFENDTQFFQDLALEVGGAKLTPELCQGDVLQQGLKLLPKHIRERREKEGRKRQKERNRPIVVGTQKFVNVGALRGRVKEIINSRSDGEELKADGSDFKLIRALLEFHPKGADKSEGLVGIKVAQSPQGDNRCFFMVKGDGSTEDFSAKKCLDAIESNPPYLKTEAPAATPEPAAVAETPVAVTETPVAVAETPVAVAETPVEAPVAATEVSEPVEAK